MMKSVRMRQAVHVTSMGKIRNANLLQKWTGRDYAGDLAIGEMVMLK
jgi:hypothetical protein